MKELRLFILKWGLIFCAWIFSSIAFAQEQDFQVWGDLSADYKINKKFKLNAELGLRTRENSQLLKQYYLELGGSFKINKRFDIAAKYRYSNYFVFGKTSIHRFSADISYDNKWKRFSYQIRGRYQQNWFISDYKQEYSMQNWRTKFKLSYDIRKNKLDPFFSFEHFMGLNGEYQWLSTDWRLTIGADYPVNKWSDISISYMVESELYRANPLTAYVFAVSYKIDLN
jgi:hypothetical protein